MSVPDHIVRVIFLSDERVLKGKQYHYNIPGALLGDLVTGPGSTGPAVVVGYGRRGYDGPCRLGSYWQSNEQDMSHQYQQRAQTLRHSAQHTHEQESAPMKKTAGSTATTTRLDAVAEDIAELQAEAKRLRKEAKAQAKRDRAVAEHKALQTQRREDAREALHSIATDTRARKADRIAAAIALLDRT